MDQSLRMWSRRTNVYKEIVEWIITVWSWAWCGGTDFEPCFNPDPVKRDETDKAGGVGGSLLSTSSPRWSEGCSSAPQGELFRAHSALIGKRAEGVPASRNRAACQRLGVADVLEDMETHTCPAGVWRCVCVWGGGVRVCGGIHVKLIRRHPSHLE